LQLLQVPETALGFYRRWMLHTEEAVQNFINRPPDNIRLIAGEGDFATGIALE
jgi:hypothetical protein